MTGRLNVLNIDRLYVVVHSSCAFIRLRRRWYSMLRIFTITRPFILLWCYFVTNMPTTCGTCVVLIVDNQPADQRIDAVEDH